MGSSFDSIPILDVNTIFTNGSTTATNPPPESWESLAQELRQKLGNVGFLQVVNHGIPEDLVEKVFSLSQKFFALSPEVKMKYYRPEFTGMDSWFGYSKAREAFGEEKEYRETYDWLLDRGIYPTEEDGLDDFYSSLLSLYNHLQSVAKTLLKLVSISIGLEADHLLQHFKYFEDPKGSKAIHNLRLTYYPRVKKTSEMSPLIGIGEHTDVDVISLLFQNGVSGLQAKNPEGHWVPVTPIKGAIIVNTGDVLEFWTRGLYRATTHRVLVPQSLSSDDPTTSLTSPRYSIGSFYGPDIPTILKPIKDIPNLTPEEELRMDNTEERFELLEDGESCDITTHILNKLTKYTDKGN